MMIWVVVIIVLVSILFFVNKYRISNVLETKDIVVNKDIQTPIEKRFTLEADGLEWKINDSYSGKYTNCWTRYSIKTYEEAIDIMTEAESKHRLSIDSNNLLQSDLFKIISTDSGYIVVDANHRSGSYYRIPLLSFSSICDDSNSNSNKHLGYKEVSEAIDYIQKVEQNKRLADITNKELSGF